MNRPSGKRQRQRQRQIGSIGSIVHGDAPPDTWGMDLGPIPSPMGSVTIDLHW